MKVKIKNLSHDCRGIAQVEGKTVFVANALPEEEVVLTYLRRKARFDEARAVEITMPSPARVAPECAHFGICGGCSLQHMASNLQVEAKQAVLLEQLLHQAGIRPKTVLPPLCGPIWGYRRKARLGVKYVEKKQCVVIGFREATNKHFIADLESCLVLHPKVGLKLRALRDLIGQLHAPQAIPQIEVAVGDNATALILRHMQPLTTEDLRRLTEFARREEFHFYLQPGGPASVHRLWPLEAEDRLCYHLPEYQVTVWFHPNDFTQVNQELNQKMVARALDLLAPKPHETVLDLFCGVGNFTLPLARWSKQVVGVEGSPEIIESAKFNSDYNNLKNIEFFSENLDQESFSSWAERRFDKILLDPPRTGAWLLAQNIGRFQAQRIVYISCNPATLARDAAAIVQQGYCLSQAGVMDMFPHTQHVEAMAVFDRLSDAC